MFDGAHGAFTRRTLLRAGAASLAAIPLVRQPDTASAAPRREPAEIRELYARIEQAMAQLPIPGLAVGVRYQGREYLRGFGVTSVDDPTPVGADTAFWIGSTSKTFTGTAMTRLVERGVVDLDAPVRRYLQDLRTAEPDVARRVTVRQLLNHTAGWIGDSLIDTGHDADALARYVAVLDQIPQLTAPGSVFHYNNAALSVAGRVIEAVTGHSFEDATRQLVIDPLGLTRSRWFEPELRGVDVSAPHAVADGAAVVDRTVYPLPRAVNPAGALLSTARDQIRYARFHLGDGRVPGSGRRLLSRRSLHGMRSHPGPGGTLMVELDGMGVTWMLRPTAQGVRVVQHGGDIPGQHSGFLMVPERDFALTALTNSDAGPVLLNELFVKDWALRRFAGVSNPPAEPVSLSAAELAEYEGVYSQQVVDGEGNVLEFSGELTAEDGHLVQRDNGEVVLRLLFYRRDYVLLAEPDGTPSGSRGDFLRGPDGAVAWLRGGGRLVRHEPAGAAARSTAPAPKPLLLPPHPTL